MPRPRTLDRELLLDSAESVLAVEGLAGLSFGAVAQAAGVAKPSVQSVFGSRDALVAAVLDRWLAREQARFQDLARGDDSSAARTKAHILSTASESRETGSRIATLLAALASSGQMGSSGTGPWYAARAGNFKATTAEERRLRVAFLAAEGAFYVRHLAGVTLSEARWRQIFCDILALAEGTTDRGPAGNSLRSRSSR